MPRNGQSVSVSVLGHSLQKSVVSNAPTISHSLKLDKVTMHSVALKLIKKYEFKEGQTGLICGSGYQRIKLDTNTTLAVDVPVGRRTCPAREGGGPGPGLCHTSHILPSVAVPGRAPLLPCVSKNIHKLYWYS